MTSSTPRALIDRERALLDLLLAEEFPGVHALRIQARSVRVKALHEGLPTVVLFEVTDPAAPRADVVEVIPVETKVRGAQPPQELLLFVKDGLLESLELVTYGDAVTELPDASVLERAHGSSHPLV